VTPAIVVDRVGKKFSHNETERARTFRRFLESGWRQQRTKRDFWALRDVSFGVEPGEMLGVIGRNGSGKSTLLRLLGGVMRPNEGSVYTQHRVNGLLDLSAGMHPELTGRENAVCTGVLAGLTRREIVARMDEVVEFAELHDFIDEPLRSYSAGMKLRLGFAVAAQTRPRILLIDEVLAVGDLAFQSKCLDRITEFRADGCAIVLISHDLSQVEANCDRALWLRDGEVVTIGATRDVAHHYMSAILDETAARTPDEAEFDTSDQPHLELNRNRFGSLENQITRVRLLGADGSEITTLQAGDPLTIEATIETKTAIRDLHFSVTLANDKGVDLVDVTSQMDAVTLPSRTGTASIALTWDRIDLAAGLYHVTLGLYEKDWTFAYDRHVNAYDLLVEGRESWCSVTPPHRWSIE